MLFVLLATILQTLYWLLLAADVILNVFPIQTDLPNSVIRPVSTLLLSEPMVYVTFQCLLAVLILVSAVWLFVSKGYKIKAKIAGAVNLLAVATLFFLPWNISVVLNLVVGIVLLTFVSIDYKRYS